MKRTELLIQFPTFPTYWQQLARGSRIKMSFSLQRSHISISHTDQFICHPVPSCTPQHCTNIQFWQIFLAFQRKQNNPRKDFSFFWRGFGLVQMFIEYSTNAIVRSPMPKRSFKIKILLKYFSLSHARIHFLDVLCSFKHVFQANVDCMQSLGDVHFEQLLEIYKFAYSLYQIWSFFFLLPHIFFHIKVFSLHITFR